MTQHASAASPEEFQQQSRAIGEVVLAVARGDFARLVEVDAPQMGAWDPEQLAVAQALNGLVLQLNHFAHEATRVSRETGTKGMFGGQMEVEGEQGTWEDVTRNINRMVASLTDQVRDIASVVTSIANGDLSRKVTVGAEGEIVLLKDTINVMVDQLNVLVAESKRLAREVGTEGVLGGQMDVRGVSGAWRELTDDLNVMSANITTQLRATSKVATAIADGQFDLVLTLEANGEVVTLFQTLNTLSDQLSIFATEITILASELGRESKLGGHAEVPGAKNTWRDLINNVNLTSDTLTVQLRSLKDAAQAAAAGDTSRRVTVEAQGEMRELRDALNILIERSDSSRD